MSICNFNAIQKILIPTDGSAHSACAAECGISVAKMLGAQIMVVNVIDEVVIDQFSKGTQRETVEQELKQDGQRYIKHMKDKNMKVWMLGLAGLVGIFAIAKVAGWCPGGSCKTAPANTTTQATTGAVAGQGGTFVSLEQAMSDAK